MNPYKKGQQAYKKTSINTADQEKIIVMLYDGAIKFLKIAKLKLENKDFEGAHDNLGKAKTIVSGLTMSLNKNHESEIGDNLKSLYSYIFNRLIDANINKDLKAIDEVIKLLDELRQGWIAIQKKNQLKETTKTAPNNSSKLDING